MCTGEVTAIASSASADLPPLDAAIAILTTQHVVVSWNPRAESMTGYTLEAVNQGELIQLFEPAEVMQRVLVNAQAGEFPINQRLDLRTADGRGVGCVSMTGGPPDCSSGAIVIQPFNC